MKNWVEKCKELSNKFGGTIEFIDPDGDKVTGKVMGIHYDIWTSNIYFYTMWNGMTLKIKLEDIYE